MHILLTVLQSTASAEPTPTEVAATITDNAATADNLIGIGGIITTAIVGFITCLVTWKLTMKTIQQLKLTYNIQYFPILSNTVAQNAEINLLDFQIKYKDKLLSNPCLLTLDIINTGNKSIMNPPIRIRNNENIEIIPGYFEDVPPGYEEKWSMNKEDLTICSLSLDHINPKQIVKARFFLDKTPKEEIIFECPMPDMQKQRMNNAIGYKAPAPTSNTISYQKTNIFLIIITTILFLTIEQWRLYINEIIRITHFYNHLSSTEAVVFIMSTLLLAIILNTYGLKKIDAYIISHPNKVRYAKLGIIVISLVLLCLIVFDYIIIHFIPQLITALIAAILLAFAIHISSIQKN